MSLIRNAGILWTLGVLTTGCGGETRVQSDGDLVKVQIDLQWGFEGQVVTVKFSGEEHFHTELSELVPLAGPLASFVTRLPRGENDLLVRWSPPNLQEESHEDSADFELRDAEEYFIGLRASGDTLTIEIQDSPFLYL